MCEVVSELTRTTDGATYFAKRISGVWQHYDLPGEHPLVGTGAPDYELTGGTHFADHLHDGRALPLDPSGALPDLAAGYRDRMRTITTAPPCGKAPPALFVRPDGYVALAGEPDRHALEMVLKT